MSELLLELFSEEIPARMQAQGAEDLKTLVADGLTAHGLHAKTAVAFATPRRLCLVLEGLAKKSADVMEERKGPRVGAPEGAIQGFLKSAGLESIGQATVVNDAKKGEYYVAHIGLPGKATSDLIADIVPAAIARFPWPKSMRWGSGSLRWVRPLKSILCLFDGKVVPFEIEGLTVGDTTVGHRFLSDGVPFAVTGAADYLAKLKSHHVILAAPDRAEIIMKAARKAAASQGLALVEDDRLLAENAGLTEWPGVLIGTFDKEFLEVPAEVLTTSMKAHQKCFSLTDAKSHKLANKFALVTNLKASDGGKAIIAGNERVIRARLSDAKFFWEQDKKRRLEPMHFELKRITFHDKLGSQWERMERITELARQIAPMVDAEEDLAGRAAQLCKADLVSGMVGEFPELQGLMGRYYAAAEHMDPKIAAAIEEHYKPKGAGDSVPTEPVSIAVALADKLDTLVGFWAHGMKPTGSGDPYQLRRAALGVIRIVLENDLRVELIPNIEHAASLILNQLNERDLARKRLAGGVFLHATGIVTMDWKGKQVRTNSLDLLAFFADRLKVHLRDKGARHDLIDAVFALGGQDDLALIVKRVEALGDFLKTDDGATLLAGVKRAQNILAIEEKKDKASHAGSANAKLLKDPAEKALHATILKVTKDAQAAIAVENFKGAMAALAELRAPVDAFFEGVMVNADEPKLRENRLKLLSEIRAATLKVADFSKIEG